MRMNFLSWNSLWSNTGSLVNLFSLLQPMDLGFSTVPNPVQTFWVLLIFGIQAWCGGKLL